MISAQCAPPGWCSLADLRSPGQAAGICGWHLPRPMSCTDVAPPKFKASVSRSLYSDPAHPDCRFVRLAELP